MGQKQRGFTLVEVMVALSIFALLGTACYQFLGSMNSSRASLLGASDYRAALVKAMLIIDQDMRQLIPRSVRSDTSEKRLPALSSGSEASLEFSRAGFPVRQSLYRDSARRVRYQLEQESGKSVLYRQVFEVLDRTEASPSYRQALLADVSQLGFRFMDDEGRWQSAWPPLPEAQTEQAAEAAQPLEGELQQLPQAIEIALVLPEGTTMTRLISLR